MNRTDIETVANLIIEEEFEKANVLIHKILSEETSKLYTQRLIESGDIKVDDKDEDEDKDKTECENSELSEDLDDIVSNDADTEEGSEIDDNSDSSQDSTVEPGTDAGEVNAKFNDIERDFASLKAKFNEIMGISTDDSSDDSSDETPVEEDVYDDDISGGNDDASPLTLANEDDSLDDENVFNDDLSESLELSTVNVDMKSPKEAGTGKSVKTDNKSFVSTKEGDKGTPIKITSSGEPTGTGLQKAPDVKPSKIKSTNVMDLKQVSKEGDASAKLNSNQGFGSDDDDSPLSKINN